MNGDQVPEVESSASSHDDNPFDSRSHSTGKLSVKLPSGECLCRELEKLNLTVSEGYPGVVMLMDCWKTRF